MSFLDTLRAMVAGTKAKQKKAPDADLADLLRGIDQQLTDAANHLQSAVEAEAKSTARGYLDMSLKDLKGRDLETRPGLLEAEDIQDLAGFRSLLSKAETLGLAIRLNTDLIHTMIEQENDDMAYRAWRIRVEGWA